VTTTIKKYTEETTTTAISSTKTQYVFSSSDYENSGTSVYCEGRIIGLKFPSMLREKTYFLFKIVKDNVPLDGASKEKDYYTGSYLIPMKWWNININTGGTLTWDQLQYIKQNFKIAE
jgi:hypothetical protein